jgi:hypothetical protein
VLVSAKPLFIDVAGSTSPVFPISNLIRARPARRASSWSDEPVDYPLPCALFNPHLSSHPALLNDFTPRKIHEQPFLRIELQIT